MSTNHRLRLWLVLPGFFLVLQGLTPLAIDGRPFGAGKGEGEKADSSTITEVEVIRRVNLATDRALDYLEKKQIREGPNTGAWRADNNGINGLAVLAFLSRGHVPGRGKYGDTKEGKVIRPGVLTLAKRFIISKAVPYNPGNPKLPVDPKAPKEEWPLDLSIGKGHNQMYEHGLATLALAELYGQDPDPVLEDALRRAIDLIVRGQNDDGGWRYSPRSGTSDLSVAVMQIVALRAAGNAEIPVPETTIKNAIAYVRKMANPAGGGYGYAAPGAGPQTSAAGVLSLQLLGEHADPQIPRTLEYLAATIKPTWTGSGANYFYYFHYYAMQGFYQQGGKHWNEWHGPVRETLLTHQNKDGSWDAPAGTTEANLDAATKTYPTALATLVLNIYQHFLPAYQR